MMHCFRILTSLALAASTACWLPAQAPTSSAPKSPFASADKNSDGRVNEAEFTAAVQARWALDAAKKRFADFDKNRDAVLSADEFAAAVAMDAGQPGAAKVTSKPGSSSTGGGASKSDKPAKRTPKEDS